MQVTKEPLDACQVALTIEVAEDKVVHAVDRAYKEYAKYVTVPGFRKGKAPINFVRQRIPESDVRQRTAEILVEPAYAEAIEKEDIKPFAPPKLELVQLELKDKPFIFKAVVPLPPVVELGNYKGLTVERKKFEVTDKDVDAQIDRMRDQSASYPKVERPVENGDLVIADIAVKVDGRPELEEPRGTMAEIGGDNIPGFDENVIGMSEGETKSFTLTYPEGYAEEDLAGATGEFTVNVREVRHKELPELNDEFAGTASRGRVETVADLRSDIRTQMEQSLKENADDQAQSDLVDQIVAGSTVTFPPVLVDNEVDEDARELMQQLEGRKMTLETYLAQTGKSREDLLAEMREAAEKRVKTSLVLGKIVEVESLSISDEDVDKEIVERAERGNTTAAAFRAYLEKENAMDRLRNQTQAKKVLDFLLGCAIIKDKVVTSAEGESAEGEVSESEPKATKPAAKRGAKKKASDDQ